jgi:hypothetical protein
MKIAILSANLGGFDISTEHVKQELSPEIELVEHQFTDNDFPPIIGLTPRLQYRIPKLFGWEMFPGYDYYFWIDGAMSIKNPKTIAWFLEKCQDHDLVLYKHPKRTTIQDESDFIEAKLKDKNQYIMSRYQNGLHAEQVKLAKSDPTFIDDKLYASTLFMYKNTEKVQNFMKLWWYYQSRYYTCDQVNLSYVIHKAGISVYGIDGNVFRNEFFQQWHHKN